MTRGVLIVVEGPDGTGKTTVCKKIQEYLTHQPKCVYAVREPTNGPIGKLIRKATVTPSEMDCSPECILSMFIADRLSHMTLIESAMLDGSIVVMDRYYHSTFCYQSRVLSMDSINKLHELFAHKIVRPSLVLHLDADVDTLMARLENTKKKLDVFETREVLRMVRNTYLHLQRLSSFCAKDTIITIPTTTLSIQEVVAACIDYVDSYVGTHESAQVSPVSI